MIIKLISFFFLLLLIKLLQPHVNFVPHFLLLITHNPILFHLLSEENPAFHCLLSQNHLHNKLTKTFLTYKSKLITNFAVLLVLKKILLDEMWQRFFPRFIPSFSELLLMVLLHILKLLDWYLLIHPKLFKNLLH